MSTDTSYADEYDALQRMIAASNRTLKECAAHLYPHHKPETSYARLKTKLDPNGTEQVLRGRRSHGVLRAFRSALLHLR